VELDQFDVQHPQVTAEEREIGVRVFVADLKNRHDIHGLLRWCCFSGQGDKLSLT